MRFLRKEKVVEDLPPEMEFTKDEIMGCLILVSMLDENQYTHSKIKSLILKTKSARELNATAVIYDHKVV